MIDDNFKITLKAARINSSLTQKEAAKRLGVSNQTLLKWEKNPELVPGRRIVDICKIYDIPPHRVIFLPNE